MLVFAPEFEAVERINAALSHYGRLDGDGRPALGLLPRELLALIKGIDEKCFLIPAHLWTPWFGLYGSKSGYDSLEECFGNHAAEIPAIETGLSSDPAMNWSVPSLDNVSIMSFSDAHSAPNLGRELTVMNGEMTYDGLLQAMLRQDIAYTVEFYPEGGEVSPFGAPGVSYQDEPGGSAGAGRGLPLVRTTDHGGSVVPRRAAGWEAGGYVGRR